MTFPDMLSSNGCLISRLFGSDICPSPEVKTPIMFKMVDMFRAVTSISIAYSLSLAGFYNMCCTAVLIATSGVMSRC
jgi:hypothetical protein